MARNVIKLPERPEALSIVCETCSGWDVLCAQFFLYEDGSFRCVNCGTGYTFISEEEEKEEAQG